MAIDIAELRVLVEADDSALDQKLDRAGRKIQNFADREFDSAKIDLQIDGALNQIAALKRAYADLRRDLSAPLPVAGTRSGSSSGGASTRTSAPATANSQSTPVVNPRTEAQTVAQVERIARTSAAKETAIRSQTQTKIEAAQRQSQSRIDQIEAAAGARRQQAQISRETATNDAIERIRATALARAQVEAQKLEQIERAGAARRKQAALDATARSVAGIDNLEAQGQTRRQQAEAAHQQKLAQIAAQSQAKRSAGQLARQSATDDAVSRAARLAAQRQGDLVTSETLKTNASVERIERQLRARRHGAVLADEARLQRRIERLRVEAETRQALRDEMAAKRRAAMTAAQRVGQSADAAEESGQDATTTGAMLSAMVTAPVAIAGGNVLAAGIEWESAFAGVLKTVDATEAELAVIERQLRDMAAGPNPIPITASEIAAIAEAAGALDIEKASIAAFSRVMADLGVATNLSSDEAADGLARFANITQMSQRDFDELGSTIVALGNNTASTESEILEMGLRLAGAGAQIKLSEAQIASFGAALASVGMEAEAGGTAFSRVFVDIDKAVRTQSALLPIFAKVAGQSAKDFSRAYKTDAAGAIVAFVEGLGRIQKAGGNVFGVLERLGLGEIRVRDALLRTAGAGDLLARSLETGTQAWRENNALSQEAEKRYATTASQIQIFKNRMNELAISLSERVGPAVNDVVKNASNTLPGAIGGMVESFAALPSPIQKTVLALTSAVVLAGPVSLLAGNVQLLSSAVMTLAAFSLANPVTALLALAAVAGSFAIVGTGLNAIADASAKLRDNTENLGKSFGTMTEYLGKVKLPENSQLAGKIETLRSEINAAGTDVAKLDESLQRLSALRNEIKFKVKNPDLAVIMNAELSRAQKLLDERKLHAQVIVEPFFKHITNAIGITKAGRPYWDIQTPLDNNLIDWGMGWGWDGEGSHRTQALDVADESAAAARRRGSERTKRLRNEAQWREKLTQGPKPLPQPHGPQPLDAIMGPEAAAKMRLDMAEKRRQEEAKAASAARPAPTLSASDVASPKKDKAQQETEKKQRGAEKAIREREALANRIEERARAAAAQSLDVSARAWGGLAGTMGQMQEQLLGIGETTDAARLKARLFAQEFAAIPAPIKAAAVEVARLVEQTEKLTQQRDALRSNNNSSLFSLAQSGADMSGFLAAVRAQEAAYNFGGRIGDAKSKAASTAAWIGTNARGVERSLSGRADAMRDYNALDGARGDSGGIGGDAAAVARGFLGARQNNPAIARAMGKSLGAEWCVGFVQAVHQELTGEKLAGGTLSVSGLREWGEKNGRLYRGAPSVGDVATMKNVGKTRSHAAVVSKVNADGTFETIGGNEGSKNNAKSTVVEGARYRYDHAGVAFIRVSSAATGQTPSESNSQSLDARIRRELGPDKSQNLSNAAWKKTVGSDGLSDYERRYNALHAKYSAQSGASGGSQPSRTAPQFQATPKRDVAASPEFVKAQNKLLGDFNLLRAGWGNLVNEGARPGESNTFRLQAQQKLWERIQNGEKISRGQMQSDRAVANAADYSSARKTATDDAAEMTRDFNAAENQKQRVLALSAQALAQSNGNMADYERTMFLAQKRVEVYSSSQIVALWNQKRFAEANQIAADAVAKAAQSYDAARSDESARRVAVATAQQNRELALLTQQREFLAKSAGIPEAAIARGLENVVAHQDELNRLLDEGRTADEAKRLADEFLARKQVNDSISERIALTRELAVAQREFEESQLATGVEAALLGDDSMNEGERARAMAAYNAMAAKAKSLEAAIANGTMSEDEALDAVGRAGIDAASAYDGAARNRATAKNRGEREGAVISRESFEAQRALFGRGDLSDEELQIQLQLEAQRARLRAENAQLAASEKFDVEERLRLYEQQLRNEAEINQLQETRRRISQAVEATLQAQKDLELQGVTSAAARLEIEQRYQNLLSKREVTKEEKEQQKEQVEITREGERLSHIRDKALELRDLLFQSMNEGSERGTRAMVQNYLRGLADIAKRRAFEWLANTATKAITGVDVSEGEDGLFRRPNRGEVSDQSGIPQKNGLPDWMSAAGALLGGNGFAGTLGGAPSGTADKTQGGKKLESAVFYIENAVENIKEATIITRQTTAGGSSSGGPGSKPSGEQVAFSILGSLLKA